MCLPHFIFYHIPFNGFLEVLKMHISYKLKKERCAGIRMGMWTFLQMGVNFFLPP